MPKRLLVADLASSDAAFTFTPQHLKAYGTFELQVLEELLRLDPSPETARLHAEVAAKIRRRIGWTQQVAPQDEEKFLRAFYTAERADLESERLFGRDRADKDAAAYSKT